MTDPSSLCRRSAVLAAAMLAATSAALATPALPPGCAWRDADPAFRPNQYLSCPAPDGGREVENAPFALLGADEPFTAAMFAAADKGDGNAMRMVGDFYAGYWKTRGDPALATRWYRRAAEAGDAQAMVSLALALKGGRGIAEDSDAAQDWMRKAKARAVAANDTQAMIAISYALLSLPGQEKDEAGSWVERSAAGGNTLGMLQMAGRAEFGVPRDPAAAQRWYRTILATGDPEFLPLIGSLYRRGLFPMTKDSAEAVRIYRLAAAKGAVIAMLFLAQMYETGDGVDQDPAEAVHWYSAAAALGDAGAMEALAQAYRDGHGVAADPAAAAHWAAAAIRRRQQTPVSANVITVMPKKD